ncbi:MULTISPECIES: type III secretion system inner membrane ring lipoprotein SctJ [Halomonadaceae]|nr:MULTISPECIES: type III secretion inner membrane ring lipoprotein SctJ [Halomonas]NAO94832.1 EscJ/YscJ/HrcJ family type III secretion inner membrane ring protein [Halomonas sp. MG34]PKH60420.1 EscJ/YscJ/HrcJ family type III secretion inner membrane ring protein [Halomonas sp. Choline-3u-9]QGQ71819.1 EscJ/YscJ/HrcJ family type III secretion inner membrane ring protein [Halomonas sp. PA16-9]UEQ03821.1 type III secretion inner membrane ring lipoprotein SctJ [Halomonas profundus]MCD1588467.1 typ
MHFNKQFDGKQQVSQRRWRNALRGMVFLVMALLLQACDTDLYTNLDEREANIIVATLARNGIPAARQAQDEGQMTVTVSEERFAEAVEILDRAGLPEQKFANMGDIFQGNGLVSSPVQERAQMIFALSQELSHTVSQIDGVLSARVHVVLPDNDLLQQNSTPSSASVFVRYIPSLEIAPLIPQIKTLVANGIAGLSYDKVSVVPVVSAIPEEMDTLPQPMMGSFLGVAMPASSVSRIGWIIGLLSVAVIGLAGAVCWLVWRQRRQRPYSLTTAP